MQITPDQIPLLIKLQKKFKEWMGERQIGDWVMQGNRIGFVSSTTFQGKDKEGKEHTFINVVFTHEDYLATNDVDDLLRIPLALDPECSGRCLWGMLEGYKSLNSGTPAILCVKRNGIADAIAYQSDNPYTALLKALIEQEAHND